jgi:membrane-associated phospholipid phosphatase
MSHRMSLRTCVLPRVRAARASAALLAAVLAFPATAAHAGDELRVDWPVDGAITAGALAVWGGSQLLQKKLAAATCRWCEPGALDTSVRDALRWSDPEAANLASNVWAFALVPAAGVGLLALGANAENRADEMATNAVLIAESVALAGSANQIFKFAVGRERPFVHALPPEDKPLTANPADNNTSFYSGHTSFAFSLAASAGMVASIRHYRWAPAIWAAGMASAALVGYLRIAADKHYFTDVLTGAGAGAAFGVAVPALHRKSNTLSLAPLPGSGVMLVLKLQP